jgi:hypothetical protein
LESDYLVILLWVVQISLAVGLALIDAVRRQWLLCLATLVGLVIGLSPLYTIRGQFLTVPFSLIALYSVIVLIAAYGIGRRWFAFSISIVLFAFLMLGRNVPGTMHSAVLTQLSLVGAILEFFCILLAVLAARETTRQVKRLAESKQATRG